MLEHLTGGDATVTDLLIDWYSMVVGCWTEKPALAHADPRAPVGPKRTLIAEPIRRWLGAHHQRVEVAHIGQSFHPFLTKKLCTIDEIKMTTRGATTMHDIYTSLKAWTTRGNGTMEVNVKFGQVNTMSRPVMLAIDVERRRTDATRR